jgi:hypothetical protein
MRGWEASKTGALHPLLQRGLISQNSFCFSTKCYSQKTLDLPSNFLGRRINQGKAMYICLSV